MKGIPGAIRLSHHITRVSEAGIPKGFNPFVRRRHVSRLIAPLYKAGCV